MARLPRFEDVQAVLFDVDGTLYDQRPLRRRLRSELLRLPFRKGMRNALATWRAISAFRRTLEELRHVPPGSGLAELRFVRAAERARMPVEELRAIVADWMFERPLPLLGACARPGLKELVTWLVEKGRRVGTLSDYPSAAKLEALGIASQVVLRLSCIDPDIDALKPDPRGFRRACAIWQLAPQRVLYIGDRQAVDGRGARAAGMPCWIIGSGGLVAVREALAT